MRLFIEDENTGDLNVDSTLYAIEDFEKLKKARKKNLRLLKKEIAYIYFFCDLSSDFQWNTNKEDRAKDVMRRVGLPKDWEPDDLVKACMKVYKYLSQTVSSNLLESCYIAVEKLQAHLNTLDLNERNETSGTPIWNPKIISDIVKNVPELLKAIQQAEAEYIKGQNINDKLRGDKIKTFYEDGISPKFS